jgi:hypothetical protein
MATVMVVVMFPVASDHASLRQFLHNAGTCPENWST